MPYKFQLNIAYSQELPFFHRLFPVFLGLLCIGSAPMMPWKPPAANAWEVLAAMVHFFLAESMEIYELSLVISIVINSD